MCVALLFTGCGGQSGGPKLTAFQAVVKKYKQMPSPLDGLEVRQKFNLELSQLQDAFNKIPFDPKTNREEAKAITKLWESDMQRNYSGQLYMQLEDSVGVIYGKLIQ